MIRLILVEDDGRLLETLARIFSPLPEFAVEYFSSAEDALLQADWANVDVLLTDLDLPGDSGIQLIAAVGKRNPAVIPLVHTVHDDRQTLFAALRAGAFGYVTKGCIATDLVAAVTGSVRGISPISPAIARYLIEEFHPAERRDLGEDRSLTIRETQLLELLAQGFIYKEIATKLDISTHTVHGHVKKIYGKLHAVNRSEALRKAASLGYLTPP
jgi:two-component system NarL family response regulator